MRRRTTGLVIALGLLLTGCGTLIVIPSGAEQVIKRVVFSHTGLTVSHVGCPSGVHAKAGTSFDCHFTAQGQRYTAHMVITKVKGTAVYYQVSTARR
jgi:hypothetical protein